MRKKILLLIPALLVLLLIVIALQPADYRVTRSTVVAAPAAVLFEQVNDFHKWEAWSPWAKLDPAMKTTYEGSAAGPGAVYTWTGNDKVGEGRMTILTNHPSDSIGIQLEFIRPFADRCATEFTFTAQGTNTLVSWSMAGHKNFIAKAFCMVISMDRAIGGDFEKGLAQLGAVATARK